MIHNVQKGDPITADLMNAVIDALNTHPAQFVPDDLDVLPLRNISNNTVPRYGVLGLGDPVWGPDQDLPEFLRRPTLSGHQPHYELHKGRWGVALVETDDGQIADFAVSGVVPTRVYVNGADDQYCDIIEGKTDGDYTCYLGTGSTGAQILWREGGSAGTVEWAIVRLGNHTGPIPFQLKTSLTPGGTAWAYLTEPDGTIIDESTPLTVTVTDTIGDKRAVGKDDAGGGDGALGLAEVLSDGTVAIQWVHQQAKRCSAILTADAGPGASVNVDNVVPLDGGMSPVTSSSATLSCTMPPAARALDNATCVIEWDENGDAWKIVQVHEQARSIRGTLGGAMTAGSTTSQTISSPVSCDGGQVPSGTLTGYNVFDWDADSGGVVALLWNEATDHYEMWQVECPA